MPLFLIIRDAHLLNTYWALILPPLANPVGIFLMRGFIETLPKDLENAARLDGCSELSVYWRIIVPLVKPALVVLGIFYLMNQWNSFLWPLVVTRSSDMYVLTVGIASLKGLLSVDWGLIAAGSLMTLLPLVVLFVIFQRYFEAASLSGALKE
jgi:ABC-type glycerol-3-phosphate transport system permease component